MIRGIKFVNVPVRNEKEAVKFYTEKLGFRVLTDQPFNDKQRWIELGIPATAIPNSCSLTWTGRGHSEAAADDVLERRCAGHIASAERQGRGLCYGTKNRTLGNGGSIQRSGRKPILPVLEIGVHCLKDPGSGFVRVLGRSAGILCFYDVLRKSLVHGRICIGAERYVANGTASYPCGKQHFALAGTSHSN